MTGILEVYSLHWDEGDWRFTSGLKATPETIADAWRSDCQVLFFGPEGGSLAYDVDEEGQEVVCLNAGSWLKLSTLVLSPWQRQAVALALLAIEEM